MYFLIILEVYLFLTISNHENIINVKQTSDEGMLGQEYIQKGVLQCAKNLESQTTTSSYNTCVHSFVAPK